MDLSFQLYTPKLGEKLPIETSIIEYQLLFFSKN